MLIVLLPGCGGEATETTGAGPDFKVDILPVLTRHCAGCHGSSGCTIDGTCFLDFPELMSTQTQDIPDCKDMTFAECSALTIKIGVMPPGGCLPGQGKCITTSEYEQLKQWVDNGAPL